MGESLVPVLKLSSFSSRRSAAVG